MNIIDILNPKSIAIIGASSEENKIGNIILRNLKNYFRVYPINPKKREIEGLKCYKNLDEVEDDIDWAILSLPAEKCVNAIRECVKKGVKLAIIIASGFGEVGKKQLEKEIKESVGNAGRIIGPNTLGLLMPFKNLNTIFIPNIKYKKGEIAFVAQSGSLGVILMEDLAKENIGISFFLGLGNRLDINENEVLDFLEKDGHTKIIALYLESFFNAREFFEKGKRISLKKPIILLKAGKNNDSKEAIKSHTGRISKMSPNLLKYVMKQNGVIEANDLEDITDFSKALSRYSRGGGRIAIITSAGGLGVISADYISDFDELELARFDKKTVEKLSKLLPPFASYKNPIDLTADVTNEMYSKALEIVAKCRNVDMILCLLQFHPSKVNEELIDILKEKMKRINKPTFFCINGLSKREIAKIRKELLIYPNIKRAMNAMNCLAYRKKWLEKDRKIMLEKMDGDLLTLLEEKGVKIPRHFIVEEENKIDNIPLNYPVVCKVYSDKIYHKTDVGGVILNIKNRDELKRAIVKLRRKFNKKIIIQEMVEGVEFIIGVTEHKELGKIILFGLGGIMAELYKKYSFRMLPISKEDAEEMIDELEISSLFNGYRGIKIDKEGLIKIILNIAKISYCQDASFEINPLIVNEKGAFAVDIKVG